MQALRNKLSFLFVFIFSLILIASCGSNDKDKSSASDKELLGAGATFPYPLYSKMFDVYSKEHNIKVNYQSIGSGGGQQQLLSKTVDFGASDAFMTDQQLAKSTAKIVQFPTCLGAVVVTYNLEGNPVLKLSGDVIADIYMGKIKKWNDDRITKENPDVKLPDRNITVIHRSDGSGTTFIWTDFLSKVSEDWKKSVGNAISVNWPAGLGAKGNEGVSGLVKQTPGAIGYVELIYALQTKMVMASLQNKAGNYITPSLEATKIGAEIILPEDPRVSLTYGDAPNGYPIVSFTWILLYQEQKYGDRSETRVKELLNMLWWMTHDGQQYTESLSYASLPPEAIKRVESILKSVTYGGKPVLESK
jgi:phosphate transport system substrate-binding protein